MATTFWIREGETWAGSWLRRQWHVSGITPHTSHCWTLSVGMKQCPDNTTVKLIGLVDVSPVRFGRVRHGGWGQLASLTHEDSDRLIATRKGDSILLRTYCYREGRGPATTGESEVEGIRLSEPIAEVDHSTRFTVWIRRYRMRTVFEVAPSSGAIHRVEVGRTRPLSTISHVSFAHAIGHRQPDAPGDIRIDVGD